MKPYEGKHETPEMRFSSFQVRNTVPLPDVLSKTNTQLFAWRHDKGSHLGFPKCVSFMTTWNSRHVCGQPRPLP